MHIARFNGPCPCWMASRINRCRGMSIETEAETWLGVFESPASVQCLFSGNLMWQASVCKFVECMFTNFLWRMDGLAT